MTDELADLLPKPPITLGFDALLNNPEVRSGLAEVRLEPLAPEIVYDEESAILPLPRKITKGRKR